ncbi:MAG: HAD-IA family hydrolase [Chloroflexi bacterium]|nr:HAD-IA family hydrolase [Chloroflexota bacterium]
MDDTLLETLPARMRALQHAHETCLGSKTDPLALWRSHRGGSLEAMGQRLLGDNGPRFVAAYRDFYYNQPRPFTAYEGVEPVLATMLATDLPMAVVTSKISWGAVEELGNAGLLRYFAAVVGADDTECHKPDPAPVFEAMDRLLVNDASAVVFIGDSPADMFAARNAGAISVAAMWGTLDEELLLDTSPVHVARDPGDVLAFVRAFGHGGVAP